MADIDPYEKIEYFRDARRAEEAAADSIRDAWSVNNETIVAAGQSLVAQGLDQWQLLEKTWEATRSHVSLLRLAGIQRTGRREDRTAASADTFDVASKRFGIQGGLVASISLRAKGSLRGRKFHQVAEVEGFDAAVDKFVAPDVCVIDIFERTGKRLTTNWLDPGDFTSYDKEFSETWMRASNPFSRIVEYDCEAERGMYQPTSTLSEHPMTAPQLTYGAGLWAVHNAWLEEIAHNLPQG